MAIQNINGIRIQYELSGTGKTPLVLVHGSWGSHHQWSQVVPGLGDLFRVLVYDRRGHSESEAPPGQGSIRDDVGDLAGLIEQLGLAPAYVAGNSLGASITLRLAGERPELLRGLLAHEPPLFSLLADNPAASAMLNDIGGVFPAVLEKIRSGDYAGAAERFMEMALGPGGWEELPCELQQIVIQNAPTFLDEATDPGLLMFDLESIKDLVCPALLTTGDHSPPMYAPVLAKLAAALPHVETWTFKGAGHLPHVTHPRAYVETTTAFVRRHDPKLPLG
jgi:pimeloyl-ACP methyl ester carboxylesterase